MTRLTLDRINVMRATPGRTGLLFITDRCPVGCSHCSVDSRPDSPSIADWDTYARVLESLASSGYEAIAISGGEPFVERRGLPMAVERFEAAGQQVIIFTSGYWATDGRAPKPWVSDVLRRTETVFLSTDGYHQPSVGVSRFARALETAVEHDCHVVVQVLDGSRDLEIALAGVREAFGDQADHLVEFSVITPLRRGRGEGLFQIGRRVPAGDLSRCTLTGSPTLRYDGVFSPCCNESVLTGHGPAALRRPLTVEVGFAELVRRADGDPVLRAVAGPDPGSATTLPGCEGLRGERFESICDLCWRASEAVAHPLEQLMPS